MWPFTKNKQSEKTSEEVSKSVFTLFLVVLDGENESFCEEAVKRLRDLGQLFRLFGSVYVLQIASVLTDCKMLRAALTANLEGCFYVELLDEPASVWRLKNAKAVILCKLFNAQSGGLARYYKAS